MGGASHSSSIEEGWDLLDDEIHSEHPADKGLSCSSSVADLDHLQSVQGEIAVQELAVVPGLPEEPFAEASSHFLVDQQRSLPRDVPGTNSGRSESTICPDDDEFVAVPEISTAFNDMEESSICREDDEFVAVPSAACSDAEGTFRGCSSFFHIVQAAGRFGGPENISNPQNPPGSSNPQNISASFNPQNQPGSSNPQNISASFNPQNIPGSSNPQNMSGSSRLDNDELLLADSSAAPHGAEHSVSDSDSVGLDPAEKVVVVPTKDSDHDVVKCEINVPVNDTCVQSARSEGDDGDQAPVGGAVMGESASSAARNVRTWEGTANLGTGQGVSAVAYGGQAGEGDEEGQAKHKRGTTRSGREQGKASEGTSVQTGNKPSNDAAGPSSPLSSASTRSAPGKAERNLAERKVAKWLGEVGELGGSVGATGASSQRMWAYGEGNGSISSAKFSRNAFYPTMIRSSFRPIVLIVLVLFFIFLAHIALTVREHLHPPPFPVLPRSKKLFFALHGVSRHGRPFLVFVVVSHHCPPRLSTAFYPPLQLIPFPLSSPPSASSFTTRSASALTKHRGHVLYT